MAKKLTAEEAFELARLFREAAVELGDYRFEHWTDLRPAQRKDLERWEWSLLSQSSNLITMGVGVGIDETRASVEGLKDVAEKAKEAVKYLATCREVIKVATGMVALAAAIVSGVWEAAADQANALLKVCRGSSR